MKRTAIFCNAMGLMLGLATTALAGDFTGKFKGDQISMDLTQKDGQISGTIHMGVTDLPVKGAATGDDVSGTFSAQNTEFPFTAKLAQDELTFSTGGTTYHLSRPAAVQNPLAAGPQNPLVQQPANPLASSAAGTAGPPGAAVAGTVDSSAPAVLASTDSGKTLFFQKSSAKSAQAALESTLADLTRLFGEKPAVTGAFADSQEQSRGGAMFTGHNHGKAVRGVMLCGGGDKGEATSVCYIGVDAPAAEWAVLTAALPVQQTMQKHDFPDGTGSIDLPDGWTTQSQSVMGGVDIKGPADQRVTLGAGAEVVTPDSQIVQMQRQIEANARQMGMAPPPPLTLLIAPYCEPQDALKTLLPQINQFAKAANMPTGEVDKVLTSESTTAVSPNGKAALQYYAWTRTDPTGEKLKMRSIAQTETYPLMPGGWGIMISELAAPDKTYDRDISTMWAIARSFKCNDKVIAAKTQQQIQENNQRFAAFEQSMKDRNEAFDRFEDSMRNRQEAVHKSNVDFDEVIRGYRTVEDNQTGERTSVDLGNVNHVVDKLNETDPGRYKQIPLRDEQ